MLAVHQEGGFRHKGGALLQRATANGRRVARAPDEERQPLGYHALGMEQVPQRRLRRAGG